MTYQEQIKHPKWQKKRLEVLKAHKFKCQTCGSKDEELHVHHPFYRRGAMIWEYKKEELESLCHRCHKDAHAIDEKIKKALALCRDKHKVLEFIQGINQPLKENTPTPPLPKPVLLTQPRYETYEEREARELREEAEEDKRLEEKNKIFFAQYPQFKPLPTDTDSERAEKFFARMKLMMG